MADMRVLPACMALLANRLTYCILLVAGMAAGKTDAVATKALIGTLENCGADTLVIEPIYSLIYSAFLPAWTRVCERAGVSWSWNDARKEITIHAPGGNVGKIICRSADSMHLIVGFEVGLTIVDEAARTDEGIFFVAVQRTRDKRAPHLQIIFSTTPEGYNWIHKLSLREDVVVIRARTADNPFVHADYLKEMTRNLSEEDRRAYLEGEFISKHGGVYQQFSRERNVRKCTNPFDGQLFVGADFNVGKMSWVIGRKIGDEMHIFAELVRTDTNTIDQVIELNMMLTQMIRKARVQEPVAEVIRSCAFIPDASSSARKSSATLSDQAHVARHGYRVEAAAANPPVRDRIFAVNAALREGLLLIDPSCTQTIESIEQLKWGRDNEPDKKSGMDHLCDAAGYVVYRYLPSFAPREMSDSIKQKYNNRMAV